MELSIKIDLAFPKARVITNDFDNYRESLNYISDTYRKSDQKIIFVISNLIL